MARYGPRAFNETISREVIQSPYTVYRNGNTIYITLLNRICAECLYAFPFTENKNMNTYVYTVNIMYSERRVQSLCILQGHNLKAYVFDRVKRSEKEINLQTIQIFVLMGPIE